MPYSHKYDSFQHSALHYLCNADWGNESDGNAPDYGAHFTRITLTWSDVNPRNTEFHSVMDEWPDRADAMARYDHTFWTQLLGHFIVSEDSQGFVHVREFGSEDEAKRRFDQFAEHYAQWCEEADL